MWRLYISLFLSILTVVATILQFWPKKVAQENPVTFPVLAMVTIDLVALLAPEPVNLFYKGAILLGLLLATLAVVFYNLPKTPNYIGSALFMIVAFLYFMGFSSANHISIPSPVLLLIIAYGALIYWYGYKEAREQRGALIAYIVLMSLVVWSASEAWVQHRALWSTMAFGGAVLLVISNTMLLVERVRKEALWQTILQAIAFNAGQLLIAWSIWGFA